MAAEWPEDMLPQEGRFPSLAEAVHYAQKHAFSRHYQVVPRKEDSWFLCCDKKTKDSIDEARDMSTRLPDEKKWERKSCGFKLEIEKTPKGYFLKHTQHSQHNHKPSGHLFTHINSSIAHCAWYRTCEYDEQDREALVLEEKARLGTELEGEFHRDYRLKDIKRDTAKMLKELRERRLGNKVPMQVVAEVLQNPLMRGPISSNNFFFYHTDVYRWWKTYHEVLIIETSNTLKLRDSIAYRVIAFFAQDCNNRTFPIATCVTDNVKKRGEKPGYLFALEELQKVMKEFGIPEPEVVQTNAEPAEFEEQWRDAFPDARLIVDNYKLRLDEAWDKAEELIEDPKAQSEAIDRWARLADYAFENDKLQTLKEAIDYPHTKHREFYQTMYDIRLSVYT
ncbi:hypothetical protein CJU89_3754 [Yarrowia sp. B02]|nr:hypothetical protein CJU89_3754 [Yarrowia sp. B02]